jgi:hypothetical protein
VVIVQQQHASLIVLTHIDVPECVGLYTLHHVTDHVIPVPVDVATRVKAAAPLLILLILVIIFFLQNPHVLYTKNGPPEG